MALGGVKLLGHQNCKASTYLRKSVGCRATVRPCSTLQDVVVIRVFQCAFRPRHPSSKTPAKKNEMSLGAFAEVDEDDD